MSMTSGLTSSADPPFYDLVVIGSSAGGIEALSHLVSTLPATFPAPIVLAQHLDPSRPSRLAEILARRTTLAVKHLGDGSPQPLRPRTIYVVPAARDVEITDDEVRLRNDVEKHGRPSIDLLLSSAARTHGEHTIAVILTGTGADGADGARQVKAAGGMVIIENPETAAYPSMPASLAPSTVDLAVDLDRIGPLLFDVLTGTYVAPSPAAAPDGALQALLDTVQSHTGIDFTRYKPATVARRLQRRMIATRTLTIGEYAHYVDRNPDEYARLAASFLINVTEFFRDPPLYTYLREHVIPDLIAYGRAHGNRLRIWSSGCATGEEAYSVAMLIAEALGDDLGRFTVHLYATDADADAIMFARRGIYPPAALVSVPATYKARYFTQVEGGYAVDRRIRGLVVFGEHDLGKRAPFPEMDMVLCRNVLIYFTPELQRRSLQLFAFALRHDGYLVLGTAESPITLPEYFAPVEPHLKVYRREGGRVLVSALPVRTPFASALVQSASFPSLRPVQRPPDSAGKDLRKTRPSHEAENTEQRAPTRFRTSLDRLGVQILSLSAGVVVVDQHYDVQMINSAAYELLDIVHAAHGRDLLHLAERVPTRPLRAAIDAAFHAAPLDSRQVRIAFDREDGQSRQLQVTCYPHVAEPSSHMDAGVVDAVVLLVTDVTGEQPPSAEVETAGQPAAEAVPATPASGRRRRGRQSIAAQRTAEIERLTQEVERTRAANHELREANQELLRDNDELVVRQEEAQAATEQAKTLNEELQAINEELETLNEEMEATLEQLHTTNDDVQARALELEHLVAEREEQRRESDRERTRLAVILASMSDALLVVDTSATPVLTNAAYDQLFGEASGTVVLEDRDGQPLPPEATPQRRVLQGKSFAMEFGLLGKDGTRRWFEARGEPIQGENGDLGGVVAVRDITERSALAIQEQFLTLVSHELRGPLGTLMVAIRLLSHRLGPGELSITGRQLRDIVLRQADILRALVDDLSDLARARQGKLVLQHRPVDLDALTRQIITDLNFLHEQTEPGDAHSAQIYLLPPKENASPLWINADPARLTQVVMNLLTNALTHAATADRIDVTLERQDDWVELRVQDYGPGIPPADVAQLFTPYFQAASTASEPQSGLGLGLFIVAELVKAHGGTITVHSEPNAGTRFELCFPRLGAESGNPEQTEQEQVTEHAMIPITIVRSTNDQASD